MDVYLIKLALKRGGFTKEPAVVDDGLPAIRLLQRRAEYADSPIPNLVILDLNLKCVDGPEVLAHIRDDPKLSGVCIAILSSSPQDVMVSRAGGADCYFSKPSDLGSYARLGFEIASCYERHAG